MKNKILVFILLCWSCFGLLNAQVTWVNNGIYTKVSAETDVKVQGDVLNKNDGTITNAGDILLTGDWTRSDLASSYAGAGWIWFEGSSNQTMTSSNDINIGYLGVNNGNELIQNADVNVAFQVNLSNNGNIRLGSNTLDIFSGGSIINYDASNHIITDGAGVLQQQVSGSDVFFPVGNATYNPATLNNSGTTDDFLVRVTNNVLDGGDSGSPMTDHFVNRTWMVSEETTGGSSLALTVQWSFEQELTDFDRTDCLITHWDGSAWDNPGGFANATTNSANTVITRTRTGLTSFSPFSVGDSQAAALPVELLSFEANRLDRDFVKLLWVTGSEDNNAGFEVQRRFEYEDDFLPIAWVEGNGTTTSISNYQLRDENDYSGLTYYRLLQQDFNGDYSYSPIRSVMGVGGAGSGTVKIYPNPSSDHLTIDIADWTNSKTGLDLEISDLLGRVVFKKYLIIDPNTRISIPEVSELMPGQYLIRGKSGTGKYFSSKLLIAN